MAIFSILFLWMGFQCERSVFLQMDLLGLTANKKRLIRVNRTSLLRGTVYKINAFLRMKRMHEMIYFQPAYFFNKELIHEAIFKASPFGTCGIGAIGVA